MGRKRRYPRKGEFVKRIFITETGKNKDRFVIFYILGNKFEKIRRYYNEDGMMDNMYIDYENTAVVIYSPEKYPYNKRMRYFKSTFSFNLLKEYDNLIDKWEVLAEIL